MRSKRAPRMDYALRMESEGTRDPFSELAQRRREERMAVEEGGGGESEGFELSEQELIDHASHGDEHRPFRIMRDAGPEEEPSGSTYGEADEEHLEE
jgi:hypothetical protein